MTSAIVIIRHTTPQWDYIFIAYLRISICRDEPRFLLISPSSHSSGPFADKCKPYLVQLIISQMNKRHSSSIIRLFQAYEDISSNIS